MLAPRVVLRQITRRFGHVLANDDVTLELEPGRIHALVGENGAGKTTLMRILYGILMPDSGTIAVDGRPATIRSPADAMRHGLGMVHQHFMLVDPLTVADNVVLGREPKAPLGAYRAAAARRDVKALADGYGLPVEAGATVGTLSIGAQQRVEILKALAHGARVLILDEPTAVLTPQEVDQLFGVLRELESRGTSIVLITHKLDEVRAIARHVTVMRGGRRVGDGDIESMPTARIAELMVGRPLAPLHPRHGEPTPVPLLTVRDLEVEDDRRLRAVRGVSLDVHAREIVGIAGVEGNGQHELIECLAGLRPPVRGTIAIGGRACSGRSAREHAAAGLAHIPSDRLRRGLVPDMTLAENLVLGLHRDRVRGPRSWLDRRGLAARAAERLAEYDVRPADPHARAGQLSGGNQQKLIAARELSRGAQVVLAAHPTRGVDMGATLFLHQRLLGERDAGRAVLLVSSELSEILALSDRVFVIYEGRLVHETRPADTDERELGLWMTGRSHAAPAAG